MSALVLLVRGMGCARCVREVSARLRDVPGVETVAADAGRSLVRVGGTMTLQDVLRSLDGLGFRVRLHGAESLPGTGGCATMR